MRHPKVAAVGLSVLAAATVGAAGAAGSAGTAPSKVVVKQKFTLKVKPNRYVQDGMRFDRDVYTVKSGGTVELRMTAAQEGPHTLSVVAPRDVPKTARQVFNCKVCSKLAKAHGADPNSNAPPKFRFLENGVGQNTAPKLDRPGDSGVVFPQKGDAVKFKVTARKGTTLTFICIVHPWMQAKLKVR